MEYSVSKMGSTSIRIGIPRHAWLAHACHGAILSGKAIGDSVVKLPYTIAAMLEIHSDLDISFFKIERLNEFLPTQ